MIRFFAFGFLIFIFFGCHEQPKNKEAPSVIQPKLNATQSNETEQQQVKDITHEEINKLGDSLVYYFRESAGYDISWYETQTDSFIDSNYEKLSISLKTQTYRSNGLINYHIFTFQSSADATKFFNDLKTKELINSFGLNKRPNHILVDSNRVYWHQLEHPYGHRVKDLTRIFEKTLHVTPQSKNLDSVSGFTYCGCTNDDAEVIGITAKWQTTQKSIQIVMPTEDTDIPKQKRCLDEFHEPLTVEIDKDSIKINDVAFETKVNKSIIFPDNHLYWKYTVDTTQSTKGNTFKSKYTKEFKEIINEQRLVRGQIVSYDLPITNHCWMHIVKLSNQRMFLMLDNRFFELKKDE
jgi:hypothetical protein